MPRSHPVPAPVAVTVLTRDDAPALRATRTPDGWAAGDVVVGIRPTEAALDITVTAPTGVARVAVRFPWGLPAGARVLGDAWERAYGDLHWGPLRPERVLPWYWAWYDPAGRRGGGVGVALRPGAFASWSVDGEGATLWLDLHNGGEPVVLGERVLAAATVVADVSTGAPDDVVASLCDAIAGDLRPRDVGPLVGANNWYHAYGRGFDADAVLRDAATIRELTEDDAYRPLSVVDAGWARGGEAHGGPWHEGLPGVFDDMAAVADRIEGAGCRPGLWLRPGALARAQEGFVPRGGPRRGARHLALDLTVEENLRAVETAVRRITADWGYRLIKYDFTFFDLFGVHGREINGTVLTEPGWHHADRSLTNAEILRAFYDRIRAAAGGAIVLGCGVPGHLAAGSIDVQRVGCDTSGLFWERTRRMGVNSLAFRQPQNGRFFVVDPDCVPSTPGTPWEKNRQFLDVVARGGAALFVSIDPATRGGDVDRDVREAIGRSLAVQTGRAEAARPVDVLDTSTPRAWRDAAGQHDYRWLDDIGAWPLPVR